MACICQHSDLAHCTRSNTPREKYLEMIVNKYEDHEDDSTHYWVLVELFQFTDLFFVDHMNLIVSSDNTLVVFTFEDSSWLL